MTHQQRIDLDAWLRGVPLLGDTSMAEKRAGFAKFMATMPIPEGVESIEVELAGLRTLRVDPVGEAKPGAILYLHGGSYIVGSPETGLGLAANLVTRTGCTAYVPDYRLAPEHPYPAGPTDALASYRALLDAGVDAASIAIAGDSAGGGLAVATLLQARDAGLPLPAAAVLFSPGLDQTRTGESFLTKTNRDPVLSLDALKANAKNYLGDADPRQPLLSPAVLADPTGFPPLLIQVGTNELLLDDSTRFAERARNAAVDVILEVVADVPHVFPMFTGRLDEADEALDRAGLFLRQRLG